MWYAIIKRVSIKKKIYCNGIFTDNYTISDSCFYLHILSYLFLYFHILNFIQLSSTELCSNIYENCLKQGLQKLGQIWGVQVCWSQRLFWVFKEILQEDLPIFSPWKHQHFRYYIGTTYPQKDLPTFPLKIPVNHRYYRDCPIVLY